MENKDKAISLFKYINELYTQRYQTISSVESLYHIELKMEPELEEER